MQDDTGKRKVQLNSKANTLSQLQKIDAEFSIPDLLTYTYEQWRTNKDDILMKVSEMFFSKVAVRSSAICEDGANNSYAGAFASMLNVSSHNEQDISKAVETVFASYPTLNPNDQVFIQEMVEDIQVTGVILTRCVDDGSPYYVLNYDDETGTSDSITSGKGVHKTVLVYRNYKPEYCDSPRVRRMLQLAEEIETIFGSIPLDIEFVLDRQGTMHLLQVRRISTAGGWHPDTEYRVSRVIPHIEEFVTQLSARRKWLFGDYTILGNMPDWNPAELIGAIPSPLAASLFRLLISSHAWSEARAMIGYRSLPCTELMVLMGGRAFIDIRASFNSFLPESTPTGLGERLVDSWLDRLARNPNLHDKVEFDVAHTVLDFAFEENFTSRYPGVLSKHQKQEFKELLCDLTNKALDLSENGTLSIALLAIDRLVSLQRKGCLNFDAKSPVALIAHIQGLLQVCLQYGTIPFSIIARHAFIAEALLRSTIIRNALSVDRVAAFKSSFKTIMGELSRDTHAVCQGNMDEVSFYERYGHLRPGTFDIMSPCYRDRIDLFINSSDAEAIHQQEPFSLNNSEKTNINALLDESGINTINAQGVLEYAKKAIQGREYAKFVFTRNLSAALETIASWGAIYGLGREDLSFLNVNDIIETGYSSKSEDITSTVMRKVDQARIEQSLAGIFKLGCLVRGVKDIHVVPVQRSQPNFITKKQVERPIVFLRATDMNYTALKSHVVCIENADPGFDWIFTKGIAGLITKYGGANSHMTIRCSELQLPAAIGCGEELFTRLCKSRKVNLNCAAGIITPI